MKAYRNGQLTTKILAAAASVLLVLSQFLWLLPALTHAETAGEELVVRVQYYGEIGDKIREKARFSRSELESMGSSVHYYTNITRVGTVMSMAARGPEVMTIIERAGIDPGSIQNVTFRTTDGYTRNFTVEGHLTARKYYYPNLASLYERNDAGNALTPLEGATEGRETVPAILALEFGDSKEPGIHAEDLTMSTAKTYRFCMGQSDLTEGKMTDPDDGGGDITSMESCHSIYGIDVTLAGSPIHGMSLDLDDPSIKVGSMKQVSVRLDVEEAFEGAFTAEDLTWTSSDESIAEVNSRGEVTVHKQGAVTITATAPDGTAASITVNGVDEEEKGKDKEPEKQKAGKPTAGGGSKASGTGSAGKTGNNNAATTTKKEEQKARQVSLNAHEIVLGDVVAEETTGAEEFRNTMAEDAQALDSSLSYDPAAAAGTAAGAGALCGAGAIARIIKYRRNF